MADKCYFCELPFETDFFGNPDEMVFMDISAHPKCWTEQLKKLKYVKEWINTSTN